MPLPPAARSLKTAPVAPALGSFWRGLEKNRLLFISIFHAQCLRWGRLVDFMDAAKVVVRNAQGDHRNVIIKFLGETIGKTRKSPLAKPASHAKAYCMGDDLAETTSK